MGEEATIGRVSFTGLNPDAIAFFAQLRTHNTKQWWAENKSRYETNVREPFELLAAELEVEFGPMKIFRPYRDVRFSADKSPYKLQIGMVTRAPCAHYLQLSEEGMLIGGGRYDVSPAALGRFRAIIDDPRLAGDLEATLDEVRARGLELMSGDALRTAPRGYSADHPRVGLLRLKRLAVGRTEPIDEWMWTPTALDEIRDAWHSVSIWCDWLAGNLGPELDDR